MAVGEKGSNNNNIRRCVLPFIGFSEYKNLEPMSPASYSTLHLQCHHRFRHQKGRLQGEGAARSLQDAGSQAGLATTPQWLRAGDTVSPQEVEANRPPTVWREAE